MTNILVIGSVNMDLVVGTERVPALGETVLGGDFRTIPGGKGANQAVAAAKLGQNVKVICRVGSDAYGEALIKNLNTSGVTTNENCFADTSSGVALITVCGGDNSIIVAPGANAQLSESVIDANLDMFRWADIILLQFEIPLASVLYAAEKGRQNGCLVCVNPAPMLAIPDELWRHTDIFVPNSHEAELLLGRQIETVADAKKAVAEIMQKGVSQVLITMGGDGAVYNSGDEIHHQAAFAVDVIDTTAAGDAFVAALSTGLCRGMDFDGAVRLAAAVGALTVSKAGASSSLPDATQVEEFLTANSTP